MEMRHLKYFVAVAEEKSLGQAALKLHISQPPLSRQIHQLEDLVGAQLLTRTPKGVELTEAGKIFLEHARNILSLSKLAVDQASTASRGELGRIDVGIFGSALFGAIPQILVSFREQYPDVELVLHSMTKSEQIVALNQRRITVAFNRLFMGSHGLTSEVVCTEPLYIALSSHHPLAASESVPFSDLKEQPLILFPSRSRPSFIDWVLEICRQEGFVPNIAQEVGDAVHGLSLVATGFGLCIVPESATNMRIPGVEYRALERDPKPVVDLSCIYRSDDESPILKAFLSIARGFRPPTGD